MQGNLKEFIIELKESKEISNLSEEATKQGVVLPILSYLNWNPINIREVFPEYTVGSNRVDYALRDERGNNKVFIEVKKYDEPLDNHKEQILDYSFKEGVQLAILTNGLSWWFYLPLKEGNWELRKFYTLDIVEQEVDEICQNFEYFLLKENVISGKALTYAENAYAGKQKQSQIEETLPRAWNKILEEPDEELINLLVSTTAKICGFTPDIDTVKNFIRLNVLEGERTYMPHSELNSDLPAIRKRGRPKRENKENYSFEKISSFKFKQKLYEVKSWSNFLVTFCNILYKYHPYDFSKVLKIKGRKKPFFAKSPRDIRKPNIIKGSGIYVETNLSANSIVKLVRKLINLFGYNQNDLKINLS